MSVKRWGESSQARIMALASEAALQPSRWTDLVVELSNAIGANGAVLVTPGLDPDGRNLSAAAGSALSSLPDYVTHWAPSDPWWQRLGNRPEAVTSGSCIVGQELLSQSELRSTAFYNDFSRLHDIESVATLLISNGHRSHAPVTQLSVFRPSTADDFESGDKQKLQTIWPYLQGAIETYWALRKAREFDRLAEGALDAIPQPTWVLRDDLTIDHANRQALELTSSVSWLRTSAGRLSAIGDLDSVALREAVRSAELAAAAFVR